MGSNKNNRFKNEKECNDYLLKIGRNTLECIKYGGTFKSDSIFRCKNDGYEWHSTLDTVKNAHATGCPMCGNVARITDI